MSHLLCSLCRNAGGLGKVAEHGGGESEGHSCVFSVLVWLLPGKLQL